MGHPTAGNGTPPGRRSNVVLIGMAYAGKSETGPRLARALLKEYLDTDLLIQAREGSTLQRLIDERGTDAFRDLEEKHVTSLRLSDHVIATGGSVIYSDAAMEHLRNSGTVVFLDVPLDELETRATGLGTRGLVIEPGMSFADLFRERRPRYRRWADVTVNAAGLSPRDVVQKTVAALAGKSPP